nr:transposase [Escherichia coli]
MWHGSLAGRSPPALLMLPRFADIFQQGEFMERFSWHVADKGFRMVRYYGFLSPVKRRLLEEVVYVITETVRKTAMQIRWRGMYQRLLKVDPLKCILCGSQMRFTGLKRGYRLAELVLMHERLARQQVCG